MIHPSRSLTLPFFGLLLATQVVLAQPVPLTSSKTPDPFPAVATAYLVQTGRASISRSDPDSAEFSEPALWARQPSRRLPSASLTKLMTALLVVEASSPDEPIKVSAASVRETGTRLGLHPEERYAVEAMLAASLLASANDACHALADHIAGSEVRFVERMNRRARELGLQDTHFVNACGHDAERQYSSADDLAHLARQVLRHPRLASLIGRAEIRIATLDARRSFLLKNKNALIGRYSGIQGIKTGYTPGAGKCLIAYAVRGPHHVLLVLLNAPNRWWDATDMLDLAFAHVEK